MTFNWRSVRHSAISNPSDFEEDEEAKDVGFVQHQRMWKVARLSTKEFFRGGLPCPGALTSSAIRKGTVLGQGEALLKSR